MAYTGRSRYCHDVGGQDYVVHVTENYPDEDIDLDDVDGTTWRHAEPYYSEFVLALDSPERVSDVLKVFSYHNQCGPVTTKRLFDQRTNRVLHLHTGGPIADTVVLFELSPKKMAELPRRGVALPYALGFSVQGGDALLSVHFLSLHLKHVLDEVPVADADAVRIYPRTDAVNRQLAQKRSVVMKGQVLPRDPSKNTGADGEVYKSQLLRWDKATRTLAPPVHDGYFINKIHFQAASDEEALEKGPSVLTHIRRDVFRGGCGACSAEEHLGYYSGPEEHFEAWYAATVAAA